MRPAPWTLLLTLCLPLGAVCSQHFLLYTVNPGEGFNLARDVYIRAAALTLRLRATGVDWVLVLPPFRHPHWQTAEWHDWGSFFELEALRTQVPVMELADFLKLRSEVPQVDHVLHLKSFFPEGGAWRPELRPAGRCDFGSYLESVFAVKKGKGTGPGAGMVTGSFWGHAEMRAATLACHEVFGDVTVMVPALTALAAAGARSVLVARFEALLHVEYGSREFWQLRYSMKFAAPLRRAAQAFWQSTIREPYLAVHMRRRDFLYAHPDSLPAMADAAQQIGDLAREHSLRAVFVATDADDQDSDFHAWVASSPLPIFRLPHNPISSAGQAAIIEQWICANAAVFLGTRESTFTFRIREERDRLRKPVHTSYQELCPITTVNGVSGRHCVAERQWPPVLPNNDDETDGDGTADITNSHPRGRHEL